MNLLSYSENNLRDKNEIYVWEIPFSNTRSKPAQHAMCGALLL
jgi:hypothetical protein